ncbi:MAG: glycine oxidase ThiO [Thermomicrobiales bacterium]
MTGEKSTEIAIIGGGIVGCCLAYDLAQRGYGVSLFDRRELSREASRASAGIISAPTPRTGDTLPIAERSFKRYPSLIEDIEERAGFSTGWHKTGMTSLSTEATAEGREAFLDFFRERGIRAEVLDQQSLREQEPAVHEQFVAGLHLADVASVRLDQVSRAMAAAAAQSGARIHEHEAVNEIEIRNGRAEAVRTVNGRIPADIVIVAAGAWSRMFGEMLDFEIPTVPVRGQMMAVTDVTPAIHSVLAYDAVYILPRADGTVAAGATEEPDAGFDSTVTPEGISWLTGKAAAIAPAFARGKLAATWAGLRPGTVDGAPIIGPVPHLDNVWIVTGHFRGGALLAPGTSDFVAESIASGNVHEALSPFVP